MNAIEVRSAIKTYGKSNDKQTILNGLDMTVKCGSIYALLGASGCGKTTLLSCIIGSSSLNEGSIKVLGKSASKLPGHKIGYMPQQIALIEEFTIKEVIYYFGRISGMTYQKIEERFNFLKILLDLPPENRYVGNCSGGQQRRVSFAVAILHEPELLILDEPTVGLDPILRDGIWNFLVETTSTSNLAVIITTHYIEEAKQATSIGLMRGGLLLAEDSPRNILRRFQVDSLEEAFLALSKKQEIDIVDNENNIELREISNVQPIEVEDNREYNENVSNNKLPYKIAIRMKSLLIKNIIQMSRQPTGLIFLLLAPMIMIVAFYLAVGGNPIGLSLAVVSDEILNYEECFNKSLITTHAEDYECSLNKISCRFITHFNESVAEKIYYQDYQSAYEDAKKGIVRGIVYFASNFTASLEEVRKDGRGATNYTIDSSRIQVFMDRTDQLITYFLDKKLLESYKEFSEKLMIDCEMPMKLGNIPVIFKDPIYGTFDDSFQASMAPGLVMTALFFFGSVSASIVFINDRVTGIWNRSIIAGVSSTEFMVSHIISQSIVIFLQFLSFVFAKSLISETINEGSYLTVFFLIMMVQYCGLLMGLMVSIMSDSYLSASFALNGCTLMLIVLSGVLWPIEGMPLYMRYLALTLPFCLPSTAVRNITAKGYTIFNRSVAASFGILTMWIFGLILLCMFVLRNKKFSRNA